MWIAVVISVLMLHIGERIAVIFIVSFTMFWISVDMGDFWQTLQTLL